VSSKFLVLKYFYEQARNLGLYSKTEPLRSLDSECKRGTGVVCGGTFICLYSNVLENTRIAEKRIGFHCHIQPCYYRLMNNERGNKITILLLVTVVAISGSAAGSLLSCKKTV